MLFAQSPQALPFSDFIRIYFSTRSLDQKNMKYFSHITFVDMDKNLQKVISVNQDEVIKLGELGHFDEHGIFPINVVRHNDEIWGYTCGWSRRLSVSVETSIGLVKSADQGKTFFRNWGQGPIVSSSLKEPYLVGDAFVKSFNNVWHMWYIYGTGWKSYAENAPPDRTYKIAHATSDDGINWTKNEGIQLIPDFLGPQESQALPTVHFINGLYYMLFCYRESYDFRNNPKRGYRLGCATSPDLKNWSRNEEAFSVVGAKESWDDQMQCYPHLFEDSGKIYLLYNGNEFGKNGFGAMILEQD